MACKPFVVVDFWLLYHLSYTLRVTPAIMSIMSARPGGKTLCVLAQRSLRSRDSKANLRRDIARLLARTSIARCGAGIGIIMACRRRDLASLMSF